MFWLLPVLMLAGCTDCNYSGYQPLKVSLISGSPAVASTPDGCAIWTDLSTDRTVDPDTEGQQERQIGQGIYDCLTGQVSTAVDTDPPGAFYSERLWFRIDGHCPASGKPGVTLYGCFDLDCRTVNTNLSHIGPPSICTPGAPMSQWSDACWQQFYAVLGHEVMHGWLGAFHK